MSYNPYKRTIHCSYCGKPGHNKSGCPDYKAYIERLRSEAGAEHYLVARYDRSKAKRANATKSRTCSFCGSTEHNRRSCDKLKELAHQMTTKNAEFRESYLQAMLEIGLGPGAMVQSVRWDGQLREPFLITEVQWEQITFWQRAHQVFQGRYVSGLASQSVYRPSTALPNMPRRTEQLKVVVPTPEHVIRASVPAKFLDGMSGVKKAIAEKRGNFYTIKNGHILLNGWYTTVQR